MIDEEGNVTGLEQEYDEEGNGVLIREHVLEEDYEGPLGKIPAGTSSHKVFRIRGQGVPSVSGRGRGDLHIRTQVEVPKHLNTAQKEALEHFAKLCDEHTHPERHSFFEKAKKIFKA